MEHSEIMCLQIQGIEDAKTLQQDFQDVHIESMSKKLSVKPVPHKTLGLALCFLYKLVSFTRINIKSLEDNSRLKRKMKIG